MTTKTTKRKKPKKSDEPIVGPDGWWVTGPFATIVVVNKQEHAYPQTAPISVLYGLDRRGQVWAFDPVNSRWSRVSHVRADSPPVPPPPRSAKGNRNDIETIRLAMGDAAASEFEKRLLDQGKEIAPQGVQ
jgi:hypothetical protein